MLGLMSALRPLLSCALLLLLQPQCVASGSNAVATIPAPIVVSPSQYWEGNDGPWSSFTVRLGTPAQDVRVLISTSGTETWVVLPEGCADLNISASDCTTRRGQEFNVNASSTWIFNNFYNLALESNLGYSGNGEFGFDTVGLDWQGSGGPLLDHQVVAGIATPDFWLGTFGLTPRPTNFSNFNDPQPSFMETLKNKSLIPSLSWAYTAGAPYRLDKVFGSLVLGGYDMSKSGLKNMSFGFGQDISRDLTVGLQGITASLQNTQLKLLPTSILTFIDSTVPHIWLPLAACEQFEKNLGLVWDEATELYLINDTLHTSLVNTNASFTFTIGNTTVGGPTLDITLPYASFDLTVDFPIVPNRTRYFPIVRASNDTQYTLGRTFLQEAYLTVDYERSEFYLSQTLFQQGSTEHIITIPSINSTITIHSSPGHTFPVGAIVGIVVGCILVTLLIGALVFLRRRRGKSKEVSESGNVEQVQEHPENELSGKPELDAQDTSSPRPEIEGRAVEFYQPDKAELGAHSPAPIHEMIGDLPVTQELEGETTSRLPSPSPISPVSEISEGTTVHEALGSYENRHLNH